MENLTSDLRLILMKRGGEQPGIGSRDNSIYQHRPLIGSNTQQEMGVPLIQQINTNNSKASEEPNRIVLKVQHDYDKSKYQDRPSESYSDNYNDYRRGSRNVNTSSAQQTSGRYQDQLKTSKRSASAEIVSNNYRTAPNRQISESMKDSQFQSLPRRQSSLTRTSQVDRRSSFQDIKSHRDKYKGNVDFKTTLRSSNDDYKTRIKKEEEQWMRLNKQEKRGRQRKNRNESEAQDWEGLSRSLNIVESDFDFRSPPSTRNSSRERINFRSNYGYQEQHQTPVVPKRGQTEPIYAKPNKNGKLNLTDENKYRLGLPYELPYDQTKSPGVKSPTSDYSEPISPCSPIQKDPLSPRRVEFADEVFNFKREGVTPGTSRPGSRCESPVPKSILRHTDSDSNTGHHKNTAVRNNTIDLSEIGRTKHKINHQATNMAVRSTSADLTFCKPSSSSSLETEHNKSGVRPIVLTPNIRTSKGSSSDTYITNVTSSGSLTRPTTLTIRTNHDLNVSSPDLNSQSLIKIRRNDNDDNSVEEKHETESSKEFNGKLFEKKKPTNPSSPLNRSKSFPIDTNNQTSVKEGESDLTPRKRSDPLIYSGGQIKTTRRLSDSFNDADNYLLQTVNKALRTQMSDLEKQVQDNNNEITTLRSTLAECLRRVDGIEKILMTQTAQEQRNKMQGGDEHEVNKRRPQSMYSSLASLRGPTNEDYSQSHRRR